MLRSRAPEFISPEQIAQSAGETLAAEDAAAWKRAARTAPKIANFAIGRIAQGEFRVPAQRSRWSSLSFSYPQLTSQEKQMVLGILDSRGVSAHVENNYQGFQDSQHEIWVHAIGGSTIKEVIEGVKNPDMRKNMTLPVSLAETNKFARRVRTPDGSTMYVTTDEPYGKILFNPFVPDAAYAEARSSLPNPCSDAVLYDQEKDLVLLGTRQQEPHPGAWVIGGRQRSGESAADAVRKNIKRELDMEVDPSKLRVVGKYELQWDTRAQASTIDPATGQEIAGCHDISTLYAYPVRQEDFQLNFNEEYAGIRWVPVQEILKAPNGTYHPALVDMIADACRPTTRYA
jgi:ADP-ribose pyrophosphatase YjhB (NUDIX family)